MTAAVYASPEPPTLTTLKRRLWKSWRSICFTSTTDQNLIGSMPDRLKAVIRNKGDTVRTNIEPTHCLRSNAVIALLCNFWVLQHY